ncbi:MAG: polysaccharide biosynthesis/export family protein [Gemmatimonadaceae bacterium]
MRHRPRRGALHLLPLAGGVLLLLLAKPAAAQVTPQSSTEAARRAAAAHVAPGDRLVLKIAREKELSDSLILVNEQGEATFPKLGVVPVSRFEIASLRDSLRARYATYLRDPAVDVVVLRRVAVSGEVRKPDVLYVDVSATLRDAIARAGGLTPDGDPNKVSVIREGRSTRVRQWQSDETTAADLRSGDQIYVGAKPWIVRNAIGAVSTAATVAAVTFSILRR